MTIMNCTTKDFNPFRSIARQNGELSQAVSCSCRNFTKFRTSDHEGSGTPQLLHNTILGNQGIHTNNALTLAPSANTYAYLYPHVPH